MPEDQAHLGGYFKGDPNAWCPDLWNLVHDKLHVKSVLDVGCGIGRSTAYFKKIGCEVLGVDGSPEAKHESLIPEFHIVHDFTKGPFIPPKKYDLIWSCEFVEHVEEPCLDNILQTFGSSNKYIMMTHAQPGQMGYHHVNCRSGVYWITKLYKIGFKIDFCLTKEARKVAGHGYFKKDGLVFIRQQGATGSVPVVFYVSVLLHQCIWYMQYIISFCKEKGFPETIRKLYGRLLRVGFLCSQK
ncbi:MAG: class I SAM-dependent methyltransferase [Candidatus Omnitrophota bacterium]